MKTFSCECALPALPLPSLDDLCTALPTLAAPLLEEKALFALLTSLEDFTRPDGDGKKLHDALRRHCARYPANVSWLRQLWDDMYTSWREPLPLNLNYFFCFTEKRWGGTKKALPHLLHALVRVIRELAKEAFPPEKNGNGSLAMDQAASAFYTRVPAKHNDLLLSVRLSGTGHAAVCCKGHWFLLGLFSASGVPASTKQLAEALAAICTEADALPSAPAVGAMTASPRETAAEIRARLQENARNRRNLSALEQSLFTISLDAAHCSEEDLCRRLLGGDAACRWFDKSLQIIATENGGLGANFEHAGCDAGIWAWLLTRADALITAKTPVSSANTFLGVDAERENLDAPLPFRLLVWELSTSLQEDLESQRAEFTTRLNAVTLVSKKFMPYSREALKKLKTAPDAFLQVAFQCAQYKVFGKLQSSYEAVSMRAFAQGRTECARGSSLAALVFAEAMGQDDGQSQELLPLYRRAENVLRARQALCLRGKGIERYLYALQCMYNMYGKELGIAALPGIFSSPGWKAVTHNALSTSGMATPFLSFFGFAPVEQDGFGVGYVPGRESTNLIVTAFKDTGLSPNAFSVAFSEAAEKITNLLRL